MKKDFDYKKLYLKHYKNLPNICFIVALVLGLLSAFSIYMAGARLWDSELLSALAKKLIFYAFLVAIIAILLAYAIRFIVSVVISQKVVVADTLLDMNDRSTSFDGELPEL